MSHLSKPVLPALPELTYSDVRRHMGDMAIQSVVKTVWKDGIDIDYPDDGLRRLCEDYARKYGEACATAPVGAPSLSEEQKHAIREGRQIAASDEYFEARPQIDGKDRRKVFEAGFLRGYDAALSAGTAATPEPAAPNGTGCIVEPFSSRMCGLGTKGCIVSHRDEHGGRIDFVATPEAVAADDALIDAAEKHVEPYRGNVVNHDWISDLLNAFYAGSKFGSRAAATPAPAATSDAPTAPPPAGMDYNAMMMESVLGAVYGDDAARFSSAQNYKAELHANGCYDENCAGCVIPPAAPTCRGDKGECAHNGACIYACGGEAPTAPVGEAPNLLPASKLTWELEWAASWLEGGRNPMEAAKALRILIANLSATPLQPAGATAAAMRNAIATLEATAKDLRRQGRGASDEDAAIRLLREALEGSTPLTAGGDMVMLPRKMTGAMQLAFAGQLERMQTPGGRKRLDWHGAYTAMLAAAPETAGLVIPAVADSLNSLDTPTRVRFYEHDFYPLSNFSAFNLQWKGHTFMTSEHAYHWEKFADHPDAWNAGGPIATQVMRAPSAHEAFKEAEACKPRRRPDWDEVKVGIMRDILRAKVAQHEYVRRKLLATGDRELVEDSWRDDFWGWGPNRDGKNMLGTLWMEVRAELRAKG